MDSKKRGLFIILAIVLIIVGAVGGYLTNDFYSNTKRTITETTALTGDGPKKNVPLSDNRNTPIVEAVKKAGPAVVGITTKVYDRNVFDQQVLVGEGVGSGVIIDKAGYIVTNYHVVAQANNKKVTVSLSDGSSQEGAIVGVDPLTDLAVVKIAPPDNMPVATLGDSDQLQVGEPAIAIGNPLGLEFQGSVTAGVISALHRTVDMESQRFPLIQTDAAINPGNSGGALVNADGDVVGINSEKIAHTGVEGMGFSIPINEVKPIVKELIEKGKVVRPYLGLGLLDKSTAAKYGLQLKKDGLLVARVYSDGPAANSDISEGDLIVAVGEKSMTNLMELKQILDSHKPGESLELTVLSNGAERTVTIVLGTMPEATN
ncbi:S1C family serine protease [Veillonella sp. R32]|uniref:S1C family serine protease n=1 Tax=Veillonella sp. R32 TaxID=2021312 RepID=UPI0013898C5A|nr:trypsin-like peptidase domain-containing protein [Veillonella sp. R32]KAF1682153.1 peptidase S1 [Veillonella sp. R32]